MDFCLFTNRGSKRGPYVPAGAGGSRKQDVALSYSYYVYYSGRKTGNLIEFNDSVGGG